MAFEVSALKSRRSIKFSYFEYNFLGKKKLRLKEQDKRCFFDLKLISINKILTGLFGLYSLKTCKGFLPTQKS